MIKDENDTITFDLQPFDRDQDREVLETIARKFTDEKYKHLLKHPVVEAFLLIKWHSIWGWYFFNWLIYLIFLIVLTTMVYHEHEGLESNYFWHKALWVILAILVIRELAQILTSKSICTDYFWKLENWIDWFVISTTIFYLMLLNLSGNSFQEMNKTILSQIAIDNGGKNQWTINIGALALLSGKY